MTATENLLTENDLCAGLVLQAHHQGNFITPQTVEVTIVWCGDGSVHYRLKGSMCVRQTTLERFLAIVNRPQRRR